MPHQSQKYKNFSLWWKQQQYYFFCVKDNKSRNTVTNILKNSKCMSLRNDQEYYPKSLLAGHRGLVEYTSKGLTCSSSLWYMTSSQRIRLTCILVQNEVFHIDWWYIKGIKEIWLGPRKKVFSDKFNLDDPHKWLNIQHYIKHLEKSLM